MKPEVKTQLVRAAARGSLRDLDKLLEELATPSGPAKLAEFTVASVPAAADYKGHQIYVSNGAAGNPVVAFSDGTNWLRCDTLAAIAAA